MENHLQHQRLLNSLVVILTLTYSSAAGFAQEVAAEFTAEQLQYFENHVRPVLAEKCYSCHSAKPSERLEGGLMVDSRKDILRGGESGDPCVVPGAPDKSTLITAIKWEDYEMPPSGQLPEKDIAAIEKWVKMGAPWPKEDKAGPEREVFDVAKRKSEHWVWQPLTQPNVPAVKGTAWPKTDLDHFVLTDLEAADLSPAEPAARLVLMRRLYFDLIGLPPTPAEVEAFKTDDSPQAIPELVDRLLASPHFGERWGRHWLDLVRYAESRGHEFDNDIPNAFQYRDYLIRAFNEGISYDQLIREHIAGDLLESPRQHPEKKFNESVLGTGFWFLGEAAHSPVDIRKDETDRFDNMIDVMSKTFLGVTVSCARCHDHKFDAISTADYYSLHGFLESSDYRQVRFESDLQNKDVAGQLAAIDQKYQAKIAEFLQAKGLTPPAPADALAIEGVVFDYSQNSPDQFFQDGYIFGIQPRQAGTVKLNGVRPEIATRSTVENDLFWQGLTENTLGVTKDVSRLNKLNRSGRTFRTPTFEISTNGDHPGSLHLKTSGAGTVIACVDSHRLVHGPLHKQTIQNTKPGERWLRLNLERYLGHRVHLEFVPEVGKHLAVQLVVQGVDKTALKTIDARLAEVDEPFVEFAEQAAKALGIEMAQEDAANAGPNLSPLPLSPLIEEWVVARAELGDQIRLQSDLAPAMVDGSGEDGYVLLRGSSDSPKGLEPRHFLTAISGDAPMEIAGGSGRLELAEAINAADNPLTHRVIVNRIWHYLMGRGIVPTTDDFGVLGQRPTNLPLLDHLANRFLAGERDIKQMIKYIVLSRTYQLSSKPNSAAQAQDPKNLLWHHRPPKRLEGEAIRDALLTVSGELDPTLFGPAVPIHLTSFMTGRGKPAKSGPLNGLARRSIYVSVRRNFLSPFMLAFDTPVPFSTMGRRNISNVPAQALILMNDPLVGQQAKQWAKRALAECETPQERVQWMYIAAFARPATQPELNAALDFVADQSDLQTWADYAHALINTKEFIFLP